MVLKGGRRRWNITVFPVGRQIPTSIQRSWLGHHHIHKATPDNTRQIQFPRKRNSDKYSPPMQEEHLSHNNLSTCDYMVILNSLLSEVLQMRPR